MRPVQGWQPPSPDVVTPNVARVRSIAVPADGRHGFGSITGLAHLDSRGPSYTTEISLGSQTFDVAVDTSSHVTWVASDHFQCIGSMVKTSRVRVAAPSPLREEDAEQAHPPTQ